MIIIATYYSKPNVRQTECKQAMTNIAIVREPTTERAIFYINSVTKRTVSINSCSHDGSNLFLAIT